MFTDHSVFQKLWPLNHLPPPLPRTHTRTFLKAPQEGSIYNNSQSVSHSSTCCAACILDDGTILKIGSPNGHLLSEVKKLGLARRKIITICQLHTRPVWHRENLCTPHLQHCCITSLFLLIGKAFGSALNKTIRCPECHVKWPFPVVRGAIRCEKQEMAELEAKLSDNCIQKETEEVECPKCSSSIIRKQSAFLINHFPSVS